MTVQTHTTHTHPLYIDWHIHAFIRKKGKEKEQKKKEKLIEEGKEGKIISGDLQFSI